MKNKEREIKERKITVPLIIRNPSSSSQTIEPPFSTNLGRSSFDNITNNTEKDLQEIKQIVKTMSLRLT